VTKTDKKIEREEREVIFQENREREEEMAMERINGEAKMKVTSRRRKYRKNNYEEFINEGPRNYEEFNRRNIKKSRKDDNKKRRILQR